MAAFAFTPTTPGTSTLDVTGTPVGAQAAYNTLVASVATVTEGDLLLGVAAYNNGASNNDPDWTALLTGVGDPSGDGAGHGVLTCAYRNVEGADTYTYTTTGNEDYSGYSASAVAAYAPPPIVSTDVNWISRRGSY
jgi:hypothetical protein